MFGFLLLVISGDSFAHELVPPAKQAAAKSARYDSEEEPLQHGRRSAAEATRRAHQDERDRDQAEDDYRPHLDQHGRLGECSLDRRGRMPAEAAAGKADQGEAENGEQEEDHQGQTSAQSQKGWRTRHAFRILPPGKLSPGKRQGALPNSGALAPLAGGIASTPACLARVTSARV